jgi:ent-kaurene oxidase
MHSFVCFLVPSWWKVQGFIKTSKQLLGPRIQELLDMNDKGLWAPDASDDKDLNVMSWLIDAVKGSERDVDRLAHIQVIIALAAVHTTVLRMVNVLYDLHATDPELVNELRAEIEGVATGPNGWTV